MALFRVIAVRHRSASATIGSGIAAVVCKFTASRCDVMVTGTGLIGTGTTTPALDPRAAFSTGRRNYKCVMRSRGLKFRITEARVSATRQCAGIGKFRDV